MIGGLITSAADWLLLPLSQHRQCQSGSRYCEWSSFTHPETTESTDIEDIQLYFYELGHAKFTAVRGGRRINVELGQLEECGKEFDDCRKISFEVQTYLSGPAVINE
jgi:hypothetical protein